MPTISVIDAQNNPQNVELPNGNGQATMANSRPVVLASNHTAIQVVFGAAPIVNLGTIAGVATENTLNALNAKTPVLGQALAAASSPVVIANNQSEIPTATVDSVVGPTNITTQNLVPAGAATANSAVALSPAGRSGLTIQVTGVYTGALTLQGTLDGVVWVTIGGTPLLNVATGAGSATIASATQGIFQAECAGFSQVRVTALAAVTGTAVVTMRANAVAGVTNIADPLPSGANTLGAVNIAAGQTLGTVTTLATMTTGNVQTIPQTSLFVNSAASVNNTLVKGGAGQLFTVTISNNGAAAAFVKFYNKATAPVAGTDTPVMVIPVPATGNVSLQFGTVGQQFATGIGLAITNLIADADATAVAAGQVKVALTFR